MTAAPHTPDSQPARRSSGPWLYRANGLTLRSELEFPELLPGSGEPDVEIRRGPVPRELENAVIRAPRAQMAPGDYLLTVAGVARYRVLEGREVVVEAEEGTTEDDMRVFILSSVMGVLAHLNGFLPIHASAVEVDGEAVLFSGTSGAGKSTMAAAFVHRGHRFIADDICAISASPSGPVVNPGYGHLKLWADVLESVGAPSVGHRRVRFGLDKFSVMLDGGHVESPTPVRRIFLLSPRLVNEVSLRHLQGRAKMAAILRETYRVRLLGGLGRRSAHFALAEQLGRVAEVVEVQRPLHLSQLDDLVSLLERDLRAGLGATR